MANKTKQRNFYIIALGFVLILLGGILHILNGYLFWYPLGLVTIPLISAWIDWSRMRIKKQPSQQPKEITPHA